MEKLAGERDEDGSKSTDRISELPQLILHHILSFLSRKDAARTCVLSKSWRHLGSTRPSIEFSETIYTGNKKTFLYLLDKALQGYHDQNLRIENFRVGMKMVDSESISLLEKWVPIVTCDLGINLFYLEFTSQESPYFVLPLEVFKSETLENLYLQGCKLNQIDNVIMCKNLHTLSLNRVHITKETLDMIFSSCPYIEDVSLFDCQGLEAVILVHKPRHRLKHFAFSYISGKPRDSAWIDICVPTIKSIRIVACRYWCYNNRVYFGHLKSLHLESVVFSGDIFDSFSYNFPCLEELRLFGCFGFNEFHLSINSIKHLAMGEMNRPLRAMIIHAPRIVSFYYEGNIPESIFFTTTSNEWKSNIIVNSYADFDNDPSSWFDKLIVLLEMLSPSKISLKLDGCSRSNNWPGIEEKEVTTIMVFFEILMDTTDVFYNKPAVIVENLSLRGYYIYSYFPSFLNYLFRICHPKNFDQHLHSKESLLDNILMDRETRQNLLSQDLEDVSLEAFDENAEEDGTVQGVNVRFRLKWKE